MRHSSDPGAHKKKVDNILVILILYFTVRYENKYENLVV